MERAESIAELEPNDSADRAQPVSATAVVGARLAAAADAPAEPDPKKKGKAGKSAPLLDQDWYRLPALQPGQIAQIELRDSPACAELELLDDAGRTTLRRAKAIKATRPVLPSIGSAARASLVRVSCKGREGGAYTLAVFTRAAAPGEEVEPNDNPAPELQVLRVGQTVQGTLAPAADVDLYVLDASGAQPGDALVLSATALADVDWELRLLDPQTKQTLLLRKPQRGLPLAIPNLDPARLGAGTLLQLKAVAGQAPDTPYVLAWQPLLPPGCVRQAECRDQLPGEREPNDLADRPFALSFASTAPTQFAGVIGGPGDVDWLQVAATSGQVLSIKIEAPASLGVQVQLGDAPRAPVVAVAAGKSATVPGLALPGGRLLLRVAAESETASAPSEAYRLTVSQFDGAGWEDERGDEAALGQIWTSTGQLAATAVGAPGLERGGWQRLGALFPQGDRDTFGLDLRGKAAATGLEFRCEGDGAPGLTCALQDMQGRELMVLSPSETGVARSPVALAPGGYRVAVHGPGDRPSLRPYRVQLEQAPEAAGLPVLGAAEPAPPSEAATPTTPR
ncbi:MAG: hypothetical protein HY902_12485 [Deltaproteobacteria bacterium]|nr:hypothetical protein [Deltaproteobacteria bacterium]